MEPALDKAGHLRLIWDRDNDPRWDLVMSRMPDCITEDLENRLAHSDQGYILWHAGERASSGDICYTMAEVASILATERLETCLMYQLSLYETHPLKSALNTQRYIKAEVQKQTQDVRRILTWSKLLRKHNF